MSLRTDRRKDHIVATPWQMTRLAHDTGGRVIAVRDGVSHDQIYQHIASELLHVYRLGYAPTARVHDGSWRPVSVRVSTSDVVVRTRSGYYAPRAPAAHRRDTGR
jgi:VWFA-related protein